MVFYIGELLWTSSHMFAHTITYINGASMTKLIYPEAFLFRLCGVVRIALDTLLDLFLYLLRQVKEMWHLKLELSGTSVCPGAW
jgi:hypothetical protein